MAADPLYTARDAAEYLTEHGYTISGRALRSSAARGTLAHTLIFISPQPRPVIHFKRSTLDEFLVTRPPDAPRRGRPRRKETPDQRPIDAAPLLG